MLGLSPIALLFAIIAIGFALGYYQQRKKNTQIQLDQARLLGEHQQLQNQVNQIKLENYEAKLNPHLFKNILNSIQSHAYQTYHSLDLFSHVLDYILYESKDGFVSPREEIDFARNFIEINKIKLSPLFDISVKTKLNEESELYEAKVLLPLITVDLIENAFKHVDSQNKNSFIAILFELTDREFSMTVSNRISPNDNLRKEHSGIGTSTLVHRLNMVYPGRYTLEKTTEKDAYIAHLKIKLHDFKTTLPTLG